MSVIPLAAIIIGVGLLIAIGIGAAIGLSAFRQGSKKLDDLEALGSDGRRLLRPLRREIELMERLAASGSDPAVSALAREAVDDLRGIEEEMIGQAMAYAQLARLSRDLQRAGGSDPRLQEAQARTEALAAEAVAEAQALRASLAASAASAVLDSPETDTLRSRISQLKSVRESLHEVQETLGRPL